MLDINTGTKGQNTVCEELFGKMPEMCQVTRIICAGEIVAYLVTWCGLNEIGSVQ